MGVEKSSGVEWSGYDVCKRNRKGWGMYPLQQF
jgi:hypothetical protein